ncbi:MAG: hypothetical protein OXR66_06075 [Candidatus Woesearchaeota archaeon]|nr:hypothetical protein [Candidatus Woesearchaeota archaeon]
MKRAQFQTLEPILVIIIIVLLAGVGLLFFVNVSKTSVAHDISTLHERHLTAALDRMTTLPELSCPKSETENTYCIDLYKARVFATQDHIPYYALFGPTKITLRWLDGTAKELVLYDALQSGQVRAATTYFTIYDPLTDERLFAMLTVQRDVS